MDGRPETSAYRTYRIRTVVGPDDYAAMLGGPQPALPGRGAGDALPDLLMVDGGRGQLGVALAVMRDLRLEGAFRCDRDRQEGRTARGEPGQDLRARARPTRSRSAVTPTLLLFLQRVRDEAHRFALAFHRRRRRSVALRSALDQIPGIGKTRKAALIRHFRSFERSGQPRSRSCARCPVSTAGWPRRSSASRDRIRARRGPGGGPLVRQLRENGL